MSLEIQAGTTDKTIRVFIQDSSVTTGDGLAGLAYNTASLTAYYSLNNGAATQITLATLASETAAHSDGGFIAIDDTDMPGLYRLDLPDAAVATAGSLVVYLKGAADMAPCVKEVPIVGFNPLSTTDLGLSSLTSVLADTNELQTDWANGGRLDVILDARASQSTVDDILTDTGTTIPGTISTLQGNVTDILTDTGTTIPATLTSMSGATFNTSTDSLEALRNRGDAAWITATGFSTLDAAGVRTAVGLASANLDTQLGAIDSDTGAIKAVTDALPDAGALTSLATATALGAVDTVVDAIKVTTDKLDTALVLDGSVYQYTANALELAPSGGGGGGDATEAKQDAIIAALAVVDGNVDLILADTNELQGDWVNGGRLDLILDGRASQASVDTIDSIVDDILVDTGTTLPSTLTTIDTVVDGIKAKTDSLTFTVSGQVDANIQYVNDVQVGGTGAEGNEWGPV